MNAPPKKTPDLAAPSLAILAGVPRGMEVYFSQLARLAGWQAGKDGAGKASVRVTNGALVFDHEGEQTEMVLPVRAAKILRYLQGLQNGAAKTPSKISIGPSTLLPQDFLLIDESGQGVRLTEKETAILICLSRANGKAVTRQSLLDEVWEYAKGVETHTLETHIYRLRQKIEIDPANPAYLITKEDGYTLIV